MGLLSVCQEFSCQPGFGAIRRGFFGAKMINVYVENANFKKRVREWKILYKTYFCIAFIYSKLYYFNKKNLQNM